MSEEDVQLLKAVRDWRPPETLHPMAMYAWKVYEDAEMKLSEDGIQEIRSALDVYEEDLKGLAEALEGLVRFMLYVGDLGDEKAGQDVADLMREYTHLFEPFWKHVGEALTNVGAEGRSSFEQFTDHDGTSDKVAPTFGEGAPSGTVPLTNLAPPARPPPWAPKGGAPKKPK